MLLVIAYSRRARQTLRNVCRAHEEIVVRQFGRVALLEETEFGSFQALRLQEKHGEAIQIEVTNSFDATEMVRPAIREAAVAYESRENSSVPYDRFRTGTDYPSATTMKEQML